MWEILYSRPLQFIIERIIEIGLYLQSYLKIKLAHFLWITVYKV